LRSRTVITSDGPIRLREVPESHANGSWTVLRSMTISLQGAQLNLAPEQTFADNQYVSGIETMSKK
jgi:hypothetical protein